MSLDESLTVIWRNDARDMSAKSMKNGAFSVDVSLYSDWSFPVSSLENIQASIAPSVESLNNYIAKKYEPASESESGSSGEIFQYGVDNLEPIMDQRRIHKVTTGFVVKCTRCSAKLTMRFNASASELRYVELTHIHIYTYRSVYMGRVRGKKAFTFGGLH